MIKQCAICGKDFETRYACRKYCSDACYRKKDRRRSREYRSPRIKNKVEQAADKPVKTLDDWAREARECNLDYGTYRALIDAGKTLEEIKAIYGNRTLATHSHCQRHKTD